MNQLTVSIVIPCYNSEKSISLLVKEINLEMPEAEVILVNDGSIDKTWITLKELSKEYTNVVAIDLFKNSGQHNALLTGINESTGGVVVTMDDDLQHQPKDIKKLVAKVADGADLVYGVPDQEKQPYFRKLLSDSCKWFFEKFLSMKNFAKSSSFRAFSRDSCVVFKDFRGAIVDIDAILSWVVKDVQFITITHRDREFGASNYSLFLLASHAFKMMVVFTSVPMTASIYVGTVTLLFSVLTLFYLLIQYFVFGVTVPGFTFLACVIVFFAGVQIFILGVVAKYIEVIHLESLGKPIAVIREKLKSKV